MAKRRPTSAAGAARMTPPGIRAKFWLTFGPRTLFGAGKAQLLAEVDQLGSLRAAATSMGMSYRHAWGLLRELEDAAGIALLEHQGPSRRSPLRLTTEGRLLVASWNELSAAMDELVAERFLSVFPNSADRSAAASDDPDDR